MDEHYLFLTFFLFLFVLWIHSFLFIYKHFYPLLTFTSACWVLFSFLISILFQPLLFLLPSLFAISPPHTQYLSFCLFYQPLLHLPLTATLSHMQTLQTCSFSKRSLEESSRETLNKTSYQQHFSSFRRSVCGCLFSSHTNIFIPLTAFLFSTYALSHSPSFIHG